MQNIRNASALNSPELLAGTLPSDPLERWLESVDGVLSTNTEKVLRADLGIYRQWCEHRSLEPWSAKAASLARDKAPATVRHYCIRHRTAGDNAGRPMRVHSHGHSYGKVCWSVGAVPSSCCHDMKKETSGRLTVVLHAAASDPDPKCNTRVADLHCDVLGTRCRPTD